MSLPLVPIKTLLPLAQADAIATVALEEARRLGLSPLAVCVLDSGGHDVVVKREDGCGIMRTDVARAKAWGALGMGASSRTLGTMLGDRPAFVGALCAASDGRFAPVPGGVLVLDADGAAVGAVGVSGDVSAKDEAVALAGIAAAGLASSPAPPPAEGGAAGAAS